MVYSSECSSVSNGLIKEAVWLTVLLQSTRIKVTS